MAKVTFKRVATDSAVSNIPVVDGQLIYTGQGKTYMDYETTRVPINGTPDNTMSDSSTNPVENRAIKSYVDTNISTLANTIHNGTILWSNNDPTSNFGAQNITLSSSNYDVLVVFLRRQVSVAVVSEPLIIIKNYGGMATTVEPTGTCVRRQIARTSDTVYAVSDANGADGGVLNNFLIPLYVIGYNTGLF